MIAMQQCVANSFPLPHEVFELGLSRGALLVYIYLVYHKSLRRKYDNLSCAVISQAVGLCEKTVRTHLHTLVSEKLIQMSSISKSVFTYTLCLIQDKVEKCRAGNSVSVRKASWWSTKQMWLTGEKFNAVFSLPHEVFRLGLKSGELLVYIYLQYQKGAVSGQCYPSYATIGTAVGMSRKTVQKHVCALVDKGLIETENTSVFTHGLKVNGNLRYTIKPIIQVLKEREGELLAEMKRATAQRIWDEKCRSNTAVAQGC